MKRSGSEAGSAGRLTLCGSFSLHPVGLGAAMHLAGYRSLGLAFTYVPFAVREGALGDAVRAMRTLGIRGVGVSYPFKLEVMKHLDRIDPRAATIGAVNTIVNDDGVLTGHNTDCEGAARALEESTKLAGASVLVLGAGGAAKAVAHGLAGRGARVAIANRTSARADTLAREVGAETLAWSSLGEVRGFDAIVNATSGGMADVSDGGSPLPASALVPGVHVMDIVYKPIETELLKQARAAGLGATHGGRMLLHQAAAQFELYTGERAPLEAMNEALERAIGA